MREERVVLIFRFLRFSGNRWFGFQRSNRLVTMSAPLNKNTFNL